METETSQPTKLPRGVAQRTHRDLDHLGSEEYQQEARRRAYEVQKQKNMGMWWENAQNPHTFTSHIFFRVEARQRLGVERLDKEGNRINEAFWLVRIDKESLLIVEVDTHAALEEWVFHFIAQRAKPVTLKAPSEKIEQVPMFHEGRD